VTFEAVAYREGGRVDNSDGAAIVWKSACGKDQRVVKI